MSDKADKALSSISTTVYMIAIALFCNLGAILGKHDPSKRQIYAGQIAAAMITYGVDPREAAARSWDVADAMIAREKPAEAPK